ncbi:MAG: OmpA family protein [Pseudomonadota bacterium]
MTRAAVLFPATLALCLLAGGGAAWGLAKAAEALTQARADAALARLGADWATAEADGLALALSGAAPDAQAWKAATEAAADAAPLASLDVAALRPVCARPLPVETEAPAEAPPPVATEPVVLAYDGLRLTLAGPAAPSLLEALAEALADAAAEAGRAAPELVDATLPMERPAPDRLALVLAVARALPLAREATAEVGNGLLDFQAVVEDAEAGEALETALRRDAPPDATLLLSIDAPPPVFSPYRFVISLRETGLTVLGCDMPDADSRALALDALIPLGAPEGPRGRALCRIGVGAPSGQWAVAAVAGAEALAELGAGRFELVDTEARLVGLPPSRAWQTERAGKRLAATLPPGFTLRVIAPAAGPNVPRRGGDAGAPVEWFSAARSETGLALSGGAPDEASLAAIRAYAHARLGPEVEADGLKTVEAAPPAAWRRASLAALEALGPLEQGEAGFDGETLRVAGLSDDPAAAARVEAALAPARDAGVATRSEVSIDPVRAAERLPLPPAACLARLTAEVEAAPVVFAPGSATIEPESKGVLDGLAAALRRCAGIVVEIGGHTDSQGRETTNLALSQARADAVLDALLARGAPYQALAARGYGEAEPIADNATEAGRARNRRIAFSEAAP